MTNPFRRAFLSALLIFTSGLSGHAYSQSPVAAAATYAGEDRLERLIAEAKKEGTLTLYTSITAANLDVLRADFEKKYGIKVNVWRAGDDKVIQRVLNEAKAGREALTLCM